MQRNATSFFLITLWLNALKNLTETALSITGWHTYASIHDSLAPNQSVQPSDLSVCHDPATGPGCRERVLRHILSSDNVTLAMVDRMTT